MTRPLLFLVAASLVGTASAQVPLSDTPLTLDFNGFRGAGFAPAPTAGQLDSNTYDVIGNAGPVENRPSTFGDTQTADAFARGASVGGVSAEGVYAFETAPGDFALGIQPTVTFFGPGTAGGSGGYVHVRYENVTPRTLTTVSVQGEIKVLNNGGRATAIGIALVPDVVVTNGQEQSRGAPVRVAEFATPAAAASPAAWVTTPFNATVGGIEVSSGENFYVRVFVSDNPAATGTGDRDEFALDNLSVVALSGVATETGASGASSAGPPFPNPAPSSVAAQVALSTPRPERVTVRVYDALGRLVATPFEGSTASGDTPVALPSRLPPGTYLVRVVGETFVSTRSLTVGR